MGALTIPLAPFLPGRGKRKEGGLWRHILQASCQRGGAPLDSPNDGRRMGSMEKEGIIKLDRSRITLLQPDLWRARDPMP